MVLLLGVGFLGGLVTGISPCVVPVLPVVVAGGAADATTTSRWRPYIIVGGLVASFTVFTLFGGSLLSAVGLPQDFLRDAGIVVLVLLGVGLLVPALGVLLERPFARLGGRHHYGGNGSGFVLGMSLGLVFVPCAGPVLAAISVDAATHRVSATTFFVCLAYSLGTAVTLLALSLLARRATTGWQRLRARMPTVRRVAGALIVVVAAALYFNWTTSLTHLPGYTSALENRIEGGTSVTDQLDRLKGEPAPKFSSAADAANSLPDLGAAPDFAGITAWLNTPGGKPLTLAELRGKVVLVDFWTYSCINCQRSLPHVEAWYNRYRKDKFVVVGVHTPEFPFEHVVSNVKAAVARLGVDYPVAIDDNYATWNAYDNEYWPAEYLIDQNGNVRYADFGEGGYATMERDIRLLIASDGVAHLPPATEVANKTPTEQTTPETYVGYERLDTDLYVGTPVVENKNATYPLPRSVPTDALAFGGPWTEHEWDATADANGSVIELDYTADDVYLVLGGRGTVSVSVNGQPRQTVDVSGIPDLYTLISSTEESSGLLKLTFSAGVQAYDFTFG